MESILGDYNDKIKMAEEQFRSEQMRLIESICWNYYLVLTTNEPMCLSDCRPLVLKFIEVLRPYRSDLYFAPKKIEGSNELFKICVALRVQYLSTPLMVGGFGYFQRIWCNTVNNERGTSLKHEALVERYNPQKYTSEFLTSEIKRNENNFGYLK